MQNIARFVHAYVICSQTGYLNLFTVGCLVLAKSVRTILTMGRCASQNFCMQNRLRHTQVYRQSEIATFLDLKIERDSGDLADLALSLIDSTRHSKLYIQTADLEFAPTGIFYPIPARELLFVIAACRQ